MIFKKFGFVAILLLFLLMLTGPVSASLIKADKILYNGKIFTSNVSNPFVEAVAVKGAFIIGVGTTQQVLTCYQGSSTQMINLNGKTAIPGFNDSHLHLLPYNVPGSIQLIDPTTYLPGPGPTVQDVLTMIQVANDDPATPPGAAFFIPVSTGFIDDPEQLNVTRLTLDAIAPHHPVFINGVQGHYLVVNSATLFGAGVSDTEADPFGGYYERFPGTNVVNGRLQQYAIYDVVRRLRSLMPDAYFQAQLQPLFVQLTKWGVTSIQDFPIGISSARYESILKGMSVPIRVRNFGFPFSIEESENLYDSTLLNPFALISSSGVKWITDGTFEDAYAALTQPYYDHPGWSGEFSFNSADFAQMVQGGLTSWNLKKEQRQFHCVGDLAVQNLLTAMTGIAPDGVWSLRRVGIAHGDVIRPDQIPDLASKNVVCLKFPSQFLYPYTWYSRLGVERFACVQPLKSLIDGGVHVALASDMLGGAWNPFMTLKLAVAHPTNAAEAVDLGTALVAHTLGGAYVEFSELFKGTIQVGRLADIAVLDTDIFDPNNFMTIENTQSILTLVGGVPVWDAGIL